MTMKRRRQQETPWCGEGSVILFQLYNGRTYLGRVTAVRDLVDGRTLTVSHGPMVNNIDDTQVLDVLSSVEGGRMKRNLASAHPVAPLPHGAGCAECLKLQMCNECGKPAPKKIRCTNGRCRKCCGRFCKHTTK